MRNAHTGFNLVVIAPSDGPSFVVVPRAQLDATRRLFDQNGIAYTLGEQLRDDEDVSVVPHQVIHLAPMHPRQQIQDLLDAVP